MSESQVNATLAAAPAASGGAPPVAASRAPSASQQQAPQATSGGATRTLPKTASSWPLLALASILLLVVGLALAIRRQFVV